MFISNSTDNQTLNVVFFLFYFQHFGQEISYNYFGRKLHSSNSVPVNFRVDRITVPISLRYSKNDAVANLKDVYRLIPMLTETKCLYKQMINDFNHLDFIHGVNAANIVYSQILAFFLIQKIYEVFFCIKYNFEYEFLACSDLEILV